MLYKEEKKEKVLAKKTRDKCIASYKGVRKMIETDYTYMIMMIKVR